MTSSLLRHRWTHGALLSLALRMAHVSVRGALLIALPMGLVGCESEELKELELQEINRVFKTGSEFKDDPFVRAETLRVLELLADPRHDRYAIARIEDSSDMVKLVALRVLLATKNAEVERLALAMYIRSTPRVCEAILGSAEEYGPESLRQELYAQAMRSKERRLRELGFKNGVLAQFKTAQKEGDVDELKVELIPRFSKLVDSDDDDLAAGALKMLIEIGRDDRAAPLLEKLEDKEAAIEDRLRVASILRLAGYKGALAAFQSIAREARDDEPEEDPKRRKRRKLKLPMEKVDKRLIRASVLGSAALGDDSYIQLAQGFLVSANEQETLEVLEALSQNPSPEVTISLKIAMQDARPRVRYRAIELYGARDDTDYKALINALRQDDPRARQQLANILVARYPEQWSKELLLQFNTPEIRLPSLYLLRDVIDSEQDRVILNSLKDKLAELVKDTDEEAASIAAYLLLLSSPDDPSYQALLQEQSNVQTRYVFMEHMVKTRAKQQVKLFRQYFYDDLFALRLMSAAGLWNAFKDSEMVAKSTAPASGTNAPTGEEGAP
jgi:hypothetical protein